MERDGLLDVVREMVERLEAHLKADGFYSVIANMRGDSADAVAHNVLSSPLLRGLQASIFLRDFLNRLGFSRVCCTAI